MQPLQDVDDWLQIVLDHRRLPPNKRLLDKVSAVQALFLFGEKLLSFG